MSERNNVGRGPKAPGVVYAALTTCLVFLIGALALSATQPPPPRIAEFAPQALEQITESFEEQARTAVGGAQTPEERRAEAIEEARREGRVEATPAPDEVPRHHDCFGVAPNLRQTEDPQSPPCVPFWEGDNGGETWRGVDENTIKVARPISIEKPRDVEALVRHFNMRYEFYGRTIEVVGYTPEGGVFGGFQPQDMERSAIVVDEEIDAFASLAYPPKSGAESHYYDSLARRQILGIDSHASQRPESHYQRFSPYQWNYLPAYDHMMRVYAEFICKTLAGGAPRYGGFGIEDRSTPRNFGIVYHRAPEGSTPDRTVLQEALRSGCGISAPDIEFTGGQQVILQLQELDVTTVICLCQGGHYFDELMPAATNQVYFPEWLVNSYHYLDYDGVGQEFPPEQAEQAFGITFHNKWLPQQEMPWHQAIKEADPEYETGDDGYASATYERYYELLVLASGIQMAGPNLTPETFRDGLRRARFPAPGSGSAPLWYPGGDFSAAKHSMVEDATMIWYSRTGPSYTTNVRRGTYCYVNSGRRYGLGQFPTGDPGFFQGDCK